MIERRAPPLIALTRKAVALGLLTIVATVVALWPLIARAIETPQDVAPSLVHAADPSTVALVAPVRVLKAEPPKPLTVKGMVEREFADAPIMVRIAQAESQFNPLAKNPASTATGVFQILIGTWNWYECTGERTNASDNIRCARKIYDAEGTRPWVSSSANW